ncbi:DUF3127 domain-containing protein [Emticicia sp. BO119]|uniref:DUF3127 domain-containing protein n=1 Tax=Emticicia sp. BO119 TaxID=2757768 RepID=UPI0015F094DF|nr:DUF3127 domain-containing protein [Emticicia sp. BO119]MBA4851176.1 DUF3127 domain-containing protein [Emticicia sp. BO119]
MEITGRIIQLLPLQTGQGKNGVWKKQDFVIETEGQYPKKVCISAWGDKVSEQMLVVGKEVNVSFDIESREFNGRWYTDVRAWKVEEAGGAPVEPYYAAPQQSSTPAANKNAAPEFLITAEDSKDDLPF